MVYDGWNNIADDILDAEQEVTNPGSKKRKRQTGSTTARNNLDVSVVMEEFKKKVESVDVVLTTFDRLRLDFHYTRPAAKRSRRGVDESVAVEVQKPRCVLQSVEWHRLIMDEVQLVGDGNAATTASRIPRNISLAVSGTPAKVDVMDLKRTLDFIRIPLNLTIWKRLQLPFYDDDFQKLFKAAAIRTWKSDVREETSLKTQKAYVVPIKLSKIELDVSSCFAVPA